MEWCSENKNWIPHSALETPTPTENRTFKFLQGLKAGVNIKILCTASTATSNMESKVVMVRKPPSDLEMPTEFWNWLLETGVWNEVIALPLPMENERENNSIEPKNDANNLNHRLAPYIHIYITGKKLPIVNGLGYAGSILLPQLAANLFVENST